MRCTHCGRDLSESWTSGRYRTGESIATTLEPPSATRFAISARRSLAKHAEAHGLSTDIQAERSMPRFQLWDTWELARVSVRNWTIDQSGSS